MSTPAERLEYLRGELRAERIAYGELAELADLARYIEPDDVELLEPAGVPEGHAVYLVATPAGLLEYHATDEDHARALHAEAHPEPSTDADPASLAALGMNDHTILSVVRAPVRFHALSEHGWDNLPWPLPADVWLRAGDDTWNAHVSAFHVDDWWGEDDAPSPRETWCLPITSVPDGTLDYMSPDGTPMRQVDGEVVRSPYAHGAPDDTPAEPSRPSRERELVSLHLATGQGFVIDATATIGAGLMDEPDEDNVPGLVAAVRAAAFDSARDADGYLLLENGRPLFLTPDARIVAVTYRRLEA